jgi:hypothetical protein
MFIRGISLAFIFSFHAAGVVNAKESLHAETLQTFQTFDARQGVAVDQRHFYAVNSFRITKHQKSDGKAILQWDGVSDETGPLIHLDSGMVWQGKLYASHSNYPNWPMTSSVEVWDIQTLEHIDSHSFGSELGSFTWLDRYDGYWWGGFANYDKVQKGQYHAYGLTKNTQVVKMDDNFKILNKWSIPTAVLKQFSPMSNSGGSLGEDGYLYLTGHDLPEIYVMALPEFGSELTLVETIDAPEIHGQGIAWDRSENGRLLWGIRKKDRLVFKMKVPKISLQNKRPVHGIRASGDFNKQ